MLQDLGVILYWWLFFLGIGLIFFPITKKIFSRFFDQGYLFSKVIGIAISSYVVWLMSSLKILPFYQETIWLILILGLVVNLFIFHNKNTSSVSRSDLSHITSHISPSLLIFIAEELMFLVALIFWSFIRGFQPDIQGLEKFMDFGFVNSILRSKYFPPADMWFAGKSINYYYFGHFVTAFLTKLSGIDSAITYNLMIATLFAFCFSLTFSLTSNLVYFWQSTQDTKYKILNTKYILAGLIAALLVSLGANLHPAYYNLKMQVFKKPYCDGALTYWYPNATRYIGYCPEVEDKTIHEFPSYSFIVSDLHGHVLDIPFVLLFLALSLNLFLYIKQNKHLTYYISHVTLPMSLTLAIAFMTNQWDYPIYLMVLGFTLLLVFFQNHGLNWKAFGRAVLIGLIILLPSIPLFLPFQLGFEPMVKGIAFVNAHSRFYQLLILWGIPWFFGLAFLVFLFFQNKSKSYISHLASYFSPDYYVLILFLVSTILIVIPEIIYVKDIYIASYHRANTMFKLTYQSFLMFSVCIGYVYIRILSAKRKNFTFYILHFTFTILISTLIVYPFYSIKGYYGTLSVENYKGIYGLNFLQKLYPDDYKLVLWLNQNIKGQPIILEAAGDSYTDHNRISMTTGLPTIEGWLVHEWLWRGSYDEPGKRAGEVQLIYETKDASQAKQLLQQYNIKYVVIGDLERQKYFNLSQEKLNLLGKKVFESGQTILYQIN